MDGHLGSQKTYLESCIKKQQQSKTSRRQHVLIEFYGSYGPKTPSVNQHCTLTINPISVQQISRLK